MRSLRLLVATASLVVASVSLVLTARAQTITVSGIDITDDTSSATAKLCGASWCGLALDVGSTLTSGGFHGYANTVHAFTPSGVDSQNWLNTQSNSSNGGVPQFTMCNGSSSGSACYGQLVSNSQPNMWRQPGDGVNVDAGYYMTTISTTNPITILFGTDDDPVNLTCSTCISEFVFYWGSMDSWNTITFTDVAGHSVSLTGDQVNPAIGLNTQNNVMSYVYDFQLNTSNNANPLVWQSVSFSSTSAAFEFDNISWVTSACANVTCGPGPNSNGNGLTPTPEPSSLMLLLTGAVGIAGAIKRRL